MPNQLETALRQSQRLHGSRHFDNSLPHIASQLVLAFSGVDILNKVGGGWSLDVFGKDQSDMCMGQVN
jgi:hypothetical protein